METADLLQLVRAALEEGEWIQGTDTYMISGKRRDELALLCEAATDAPH